MRIPAIVYVLALGAFALITTELGVIGIRRYPTLPGARTKSCARGAGVFQQSLQFLRKSRFDGRNDDWRTIHCLVRNPCFAARQHRTLGGGRPYLSSGTAALRATGSHALNLAAE
jgi:hypothetical protein